MPEATVSNIRSIQGEQQAQAHPTFRPAEEIDVDNWMAGAPEGALDCRERGRHWFKLPSQEGLGTFSGVTSQGHLIRRTKCEVCGIIELVQHFEVITKSVKVGRKTVREPRLRKVKQYSTGYKDQVTGANGKKGFTYSSPVGNGRILPRQVSELRTSRMIPSGMTAAQLIDEVRTGARHNHTATG